jgi:alpha-glucosidase (family GH31 glycosyl hydrolase)
MVDTIMYGDALKVDFVFDLGVYTKAVLLPVGSYWLNIVDFTIVAPAQGEFSVTLSAPTTHPIVLQKAGTIIPIQDPFRDGRRGLEGLLTIPLTISALLDQDKNARGHVLIEDLEGKKEFYELRINHNMLSFKQQNGGEVDTNIGMKQIRRINVAAKALTFASSYQACAVWNDHVSV